MELLGDHLSYVLLVVFGLFAVGVHAYSLFGHQIPGDVSHQGNALLDSLSVLSIGGQYSVFRGFVFYLLVSESLYVILASSTMILQLSLNAMGREDMAGALSSGIELNPLIPILASSVIISASQIRPLSQIEHSIRRIGHRIAGIPRNVYEIQERIKSTPLEKLKRQTLGESFGIQQAEQMLSPLNQCADQAQQYADEKMVVLRRVELLPYEQQHFQKSLQNVRYLHELSQLGAINGGETQTEHTEAGLMASEYLNSLDELQLRTIEGGDGADNTDTQLITLWRASIKQCFEIEASQIQSLCEQLGLLQGISTASSSVADPMRQARLKISRILQRREQSSTKLYARSSLEYTLGNVYLMRQALTRLDVTPRVRYREQIKTCMQDLAVRTASFDRTIDRLLAKKDAAASTSATLDEAGWNAFFAQCQSLEADLISTLSLFVADRIEGLDAPGLHASSRIASYAEQKAALFVEAGASLELSSFRLEGFQHSLEKVFCLYEWTLGTDRSRIWATHDTKQITLLFESIKHKFDAFENDLNTLVDELQEASIEKKESSVKSRWKEAIARCSSLEDDLTILLALLLINKPDVQLKNYQLLDRLRDYVLERDRNHEMNAFGMSALFGVFLSLGLLTFHFSFVDDIKSSLRAPDSVKSFDVGGLGPVYKDFEVVQEPGLISSVMGKIIAGEGISKVQRAESETYILSLIGSTAGSFLDACLEVLDYLIIFSISTGIALTIRSMRKVERRWSSRVNYEPPPMYSYMFVGVVAYLISACFILLYRFVRIVVMPMLDSEANLLSSTHLTLFRDSFGEYLLFPVTAFVIVWYVLEYMDRKGEPGVFSILWSAFKFALLCTLINVIGKVLSDSFKTGWDVVHFMVGPTIGFFSFMIMFAYCMRLYRIDDGDSNTRHQQGDLLSFLGKRGFGKGDISRTLFRYRLAKQAHNESGSKRRDEANS